MRPTTSRSDGFAHGSVTESLDELARIGGEPDGGVTRVAWSKELFDAYRWVGDRMRELGLEVEIDAAGNLLGRWQVGTGPAVLVGSHLDTVPSGGHLDGVLGVVAAIHAVALLQRQGYEPRRPLWIAAFMDEEGTRFNSSLFGSRAFVGDDLSNLGHRVDESGVTLRQAMSAAGFEFNRVEEACRIQEVGSYFELHIEQGPVLDAEDIDVGIVTSIVGLHGYWVRLCGEANHAGTTPMRLRRDAFAGTARIALALRNEARRRQDVTVNVGKVSVMPGGANVVPGIVEFTIDARATSHDALVELGRFVETTIARVADEEGLRAEVDHTYLLEPLELNADLVDQLERAAGAEKASSRRLPSGAGHDALVVGRRVPAAMLFVPSRGGVSHSPNEHSLPEHVELGVRVLATALRDSLGRS